MEGYESAVITSAHGCEISARLAFGGVAVIVKSPYGVNECVTFTKKQWNRFCAAAVVGDGIAVSEACEE